MPPQKTWTVEQTPVTTEIYALWGSSPYDVYAIGARGTILHSTGDGTWVVEPSGTVAPLAAISGTGPDDVYVAGVFTCPAQGCGDGGIDGGFFHSTGDQSWAPFLPSQTDGFSVWMLDPSEGYVMGSQGAGDFLLHMKGPGNWVPETLPVADVGPHAMWSSSPTDVYILGQGNQVFHSQGDGNWIAQNNGYGQINFNIWGSGPNDVYITAENSLLLHSVGDGNWIQEDLPQLNAWPTGVWGSGATDVYVVTGGIFGPTGDILHSDGSGEWTLVDGSFPSLNAVWGSGPGDVYAAGPKGVILHLK